MLFFALTAVCCAEATLSFAGAAEVEAGAGAGSACWLTEAEGSRSDRSVLVSSTWGADMIVDVCSWEGAGRKSRRWSCAGLE